MSLLAYVISLLIVGLVIGGLGRLIVPGPNPIGFWPTLGSGLAGAVLGAAAGALLQLGSVSILFEVAIAAGLVSAVGGRRRVVR